MITQIKVTAADITQGRRGVCPECPIALAINRQLTNCCASVGSEEIDLIRADTGTRIFNCATLPNAAQQFMSSFDNNFGDAAPFAFEIDLPKWALTVEVAN